MPKRALYVNDDKMGIWSPSGGFKETGGGFILPGWNLVAWKSPGNIATQVTLVSFPNFGAKKTNNQPNSAWTVTNTATFGGMFDEVNGDTIVRTFSGIIHTIWTKHGLVSDTDL